MHLHMNLPVCPQKKRNRRGGIFRPPKEKEKKVVASPEAEETFSPSRHKKATAEYTTTAAKTAAECLASPSGMRLERTFFLGMASVRIERSA